jgi:agmatinase
MKQLSTGRFIASLDDPSNANIILAGFPYDSTASLRSGSRFAPREIRIYSEETIESFSFHLEKNLDEINFFDAGDMEIMTGDPATAIKKIHKSALNLIKNNKKLLAIGGEHLVTLPLYLAAREIFGDSTLLQLDAHADLRETYLDNEFSHACVMNLCLKNNLKKLIQFGIRSCTKEEYRKINNDSRITPLQNYSELDNVIGTGEKIYLSLDVDFFDPAYFPATGTPEAGGASFNDLLMILKALQSKKANIIGADIVEFIPDLDFTKSCTAFAAKIIREILLIMS